VTLGTQTISNDSVNYGDYKEVWCMMNKA
jgi:hypothetical protein